jgi:hypothetical protein
MWSGCEAGYALRWTRVAERKGRTSGCAPRSHDYTRCYEERVAPGTGKPTPIHCSRRESGVSSRCVAQPRSTAPVQRRSTETATRADRAGGGPAQSRRRRWRSSKPYLSGGLRMKAKARAERDAQIGAARRRGLSMLEIAEQFGITKQAVHWILRRDGVTCRQHCGRQGWLKLAVPAVARSIGSPPVSFAPAGRNHVQGTPTARLSAGAPLSPVN